MSACRTATQQALADLFDRYDRVFLAFSGGKDSLTLAHLCEPWRDP
jgi:tRNA(Ile)-lysidine synthase TilS/MesJ